MSLSFNVLGKSGLGACLAALTLALVACDSAGPEPAAAPPDLASGLPPSVVPEGPVADSMNWTWQDGEMYGWTIGALRPAVTWPEGGGLSIRAPSEPEFPDLFLRSPPLSFAGRDYTKVVVDIETVEPAPQLDLALYYSTPEHGEDFSLRGAPLDASPLVAGERRVLVYDMTRPAAGGSDWVDSTIRQIRFDLPQGANSHHIVHAIRICHVDDTDCG